MDTLAGRANNTQLNTARMRKYGIIIKLICQVALIILLFDRPTNMAAEPGVVKIVENDWPPYFFAGKPDQPEGIAKELLRMCIPDTGYAYKFDFYPVKRMYSYIKKGKIDIAVFSYKKKRESFLLYGKEPLFSSGYRPVIAASSNIQIRSLEDFDKLKVGHLAGLKYSKAYFEYINKRKKEGTLIVTGMGDSCLKMLLKGIIDTFVDTKDTTLWRAKQMNALDKIKILDFDIRSSDYFVTVSKQSGIIKDKESFLTGLDQCLKTAKTDGRYAHILKKYGTY